MDLKRTANVKQMLRNALFHRQSCAGKGSRRRKSNRGSGTAFLHVLARNHHISSCTVALLQRWAVDGSSSLQASMMLWKGHEVIPQCSGPWSLFPLSPSFPPHWAGGGQGTTPRHTLQLEMLQKVLGSTDEAVQATEHVN